MSGKAKLSLKVIDQPIVKYAKGKYIPEFVKPLGDSTYQQAVTWMMQQSLDAAKDAIPFVGEQVATFIFTQKKAKENYLAQGIDEKVANEWAWAYAIQRTKDTAIARFIGKLPIPQADTIARGYEIYHELEAFGADGKLTPPSEVVEKTPGYKYGGMISQSYGKKNGSVVHKKYGGLIM